MEELEKHAENLQILIQKAAEKTIPKKKLLIDQNLNGISIETDI